MARQRIQMSKDIFDRIFSAAVSLDKNFPIDTEARWITRKDNDDADLMANAKIQVKRLGLRESRRLSIIWIARYSAQAGMGGRTNRGKGSRRLTALQAYLLYLLRRPTSHPPQLQLRLGISWKAHSVGSRDTKGTPFWMFLRFSLS